MNSARHILLLLVLSLVPLGASAQNHIRAAMERAKAQREAAARREVQQNEGNSASGGQGFLRMVVENGDTTYVDNLSPIYILSRSKHKSEKDWVNYYKMVWRFARVYPYALASGKLVRQVDKIGRAHV